MDLGTLVQAQDIRALWSAERPADDGRSRFFVAYRRPKKVLVRGKVANRTDPHAAYASDGHCATFAVDPSAQNSCPLAEIETSQRPAFDAIQGATPTGEGVTQ